MTQDIMPLETLRHYLNECCSRVYDPKAQIMKWHPLVAGDGVNQMLVKSSLQEHMGFSAGPRGITVFGDSKLQAMADKGFDVGVQTKGIVPQGRTLH